MWCVRIVGVLAGQARAIQQWLLAVAYEVGQSVAPERVQGLIYAPSPPSSSSPSHSKTKRERTHESSGRRRSCKEDLREESAVGGGGGEGGEGGEGEGVSGGDNASVYPHTRLSWTAPLSGMRVHLPYSKPWARPGTRHSTGTDRYMQASLPSTLSSPDTPALFHLSPAFCRLPHRGSGSGSGCGAHAVTPPPVRPCSYLGPSAGRVRRAREHAQTGPQLPRQLRALAGRGPHVRHGGGVQPGNNERCNRDAQRAIERGSEGYRRGHTAGARKTAAGLSV